MTPADRSRLPVPAAERPFAFPVAGKQRLDNGLAVWTAERRDLPIATVVLLLPAGSVRDPAARPGLAALTADMLDEGSGARSAIEIQEELARIGADLGTEIGADAVTLSVTVLGRFVPEALRLLADVAVRPSLAAPDVARVRALRVNRLLQLRAVPGVIADAVFLDAVFRGHGYAHLPAGTGTALAAIDAQDVAAFHAAHYSPARATLIGVGALDSVAFAEQAAAVFQGWDGPGSADADNAAGPGRQTAAPRLLLVDRPGAAQTELRVGHAGAARRDEAFHELVLLNAVLGGHFMSRLNLDLRERRGFTYGVRSSFDFRRAPGPFWVQTAVQADATADAAAAILEELAAIRDSRPAVDAEIELSVSTLTKGYARHFETNGQVARGFAQLALFGLPDDSFSRFTPSLRAIGPPAVTGAARAWLRPEEATIVAVGDARRIAGSLEALGLGPPAAATAPF